MQQTVVDSDRYGTAGIKYHETVRITRLFDEVNFTQYVFSWNTSQPAIRCSSEIGVSVDSDNFTIEESGNHYNWKLMYEVQNSTQTTINGLIVEPLIIYNCISLWLECFGRPNADDQMFVNLAIEKEIQGYRSICELYEQNKPVDLHKVGKKFEMEIPIVLIGHVCKPTFILKINMISKNSKNFKVHNQLSMDLEKLYIAQHSTDITFIFSNNKEIKAHKLILMARSPVFQAMLQSDMLESKENCVMIQDIEPEVFEKLVQYIYTGKMSTSDDKVADIMVAADKYALNELKAYCEKEVIKNMNLENAADNLIISYLLNLDFLKTKTIEFMLSKKRDILKTDGYKNLLKNHLHLVAELFEKSLQL